MRSSASVSRSVVTVLVAALVWLAPPAAGIEFELGGCILQYLEPCSEEVIQYYLFSSRRPNAAPLALDARAPDVPDWVDVRGGETKVIVHGYGGHLDFFATKAIRDGECV